MVTVFQNGHIFIELESPRRIGATTHKSEVFFADTLADKDQHPPKDTSDSSAS